MNDMTYKGYTARIKYSSVDGCLIGRIAGIRDIIVFHGDSVAEIKQVFEDSVNDYLEFCAELNQPPQQAIAEELILEVPKELHARLADQAHREGKTIDRLVLEALNQAPNLGA